MTKPTDLPGNYVAPHSDLNKIIENSDNVNRRKYARRAARWNATIITKDKQVIKCVTRDVSEKGAAIVCVNDIPMNTLIVVEIEAYYKGASRKLRALSIVKHSSVATEGFTIGLFFKDCSDDCTKFLSNYANKKI